MRDVLHSSKVLKTLAQYSVRVSRGSANFRTLKLFVKYTFYGKFDVMYFTMTKCYRIIRRDVAD